MLRTKFIREIYLEEIKMICIFLNNILHHSCKDYQKSLPEHLYHFNNNTEVPRSILQNNNPLKQNYGILWASHNANFWLDQDQDLEEATVIFDVY